jgi:hypothetical protein
VPRIFGSIGNKLRAHLGYALYWLVLKSVVSTGKSFSKIVNDCYVACIIEIWTKITAGKPIDQNSPLVSEIGDVVRYYLTRSSNSRSSISLLESKILTFNFACWVLRDRQRGKELQYYRFILKHRLARILKKYININNLINLRAAEALATFEPVFKEVPSSHFWRDKIENGSLPEELRVGKRAVLRRYLKKQVKQARRDQELTEIKQVDLEPKANATIPEVLEGALKFVGLFSASALVLSIFHEFGYYNVVGTEFNRLLSISDFLTSAIFWLPQGVYFLCVVVIIQLLLRKHETILLFKYPEMTRQRTRLDTAEDVAFWGMLVLGIVGSVFGPQNHL